MFKFVVQLSHSLILVTESSNMAPHGKELSEDLKRRIVALHISCPQTTFHCVKV